MVPILARDSIILKCMRDHNSILGNYECAYAAGLLSRLAGIPVRQEETDLKILLAELLEKTKGYTPATPEEKRLIHILSAYQPVEKMDEQAVELLKMGLGETQPWQI